MSLLTSNTPSVCRISSSRCRKDAVRKSLRRIHSHRPTVDRKPSHCYNSRKKLIIKDLTYRLCKVLELRLNPSYVFQTPEKYSTETTSTTITTTTTTMKQEPLLIQHLYFLCFLHLQGMWRRQRPLFTKIFSKTKVDHQQYILTG